jgi:hypothetical protein
VRRIALLKRELRETRKRKEEGEEEEGEKKILEDQIRELRERLRESLDKR